MDDLRGFQVTKIINKIGGDLNHMTKESKLAKRLLQNINEESKNSIDYSFLIDELENKIDPSPLEIRVVESLYHYIEKLKLLENNLKKYINDEYESLPGNKLSKLYDKIEKYGTSSLFD